jgi:hypothetical protein
MIKEFLDKIKKYAVEQAAWAEREYVGESGSVKRQAVVDKIAGFIDIPAIPDFIEAPIKKAVIGYFVDLAVEKLNWLSGYNFGDIELSEDETNKLAQTIDAPMPVVSRALSAASVLDDRINALYSQYEVSAPEPEVPQQETTHVEVLVEPAAPKVDVWQKSIAFVGIAEGGRNFDVVNGKQVLKPSSQNDKGGPTAYGITHTALATAYAARIVGHNDICKLTKDEAISIYKANYWDCYGWGELPWPVCLALFDVTVNSGLGGAAKTAQAACNSYGWNPVLVVDGKWGPKTKTAVWSIAAEDPQELTRQLLVKRKDYYDDIIRRNSSQETFRNGWYNRLRSLASTAGVQSPV